MAKTINHAGIIDQFFGALVGGRIPGVRPQAALSVDVHRLYLAWTQLEDLPATPSAASFCRYISDRHQIQCARKRYAEGPFIVGPRSVLYLAGPVHSGYGQEPDILGRQIADFRHQAEAFGARVPVREQAAPVPERVR